MMKIFRGKLRFLFVILFVVAISLASVTSVKADQYEEVQVIESSQDNQTNALGSSLFRTSYRATTMGSSTIKLTVKHGYFQKNGNDFLILDTQGNVLEVISQDFEMKNGGKAAFRFVPIGKTTLYIKYNVEQNPISTFEERGYWRCVGKNTAGGLLGGAAAGCVTGAFFGGAGCVPGAGVGSVTGTISAGIGSLIWCW